MVARIPLIVNSSVNQIQELPAGDNLEGLSSVVVPADGAIPANAAVTLTSAGKAKAISTVAASSGSSSNWFTGNGSDTSIYQLEDSCWLGSQNAVIVAWKIKSTTTSLDQDLQLTAGTLSGNSISWGTRLDTSTIISGTPSWIELASNNNDKAILMYHEGSDMKIRTFTVSGTTITLGSPSSLRTNSTEGNVCYLGDDGGSSYFAVAYVHSGDAEVKIIKHDGHNNMTVLGSTNAGVQVPNGANHDEMKLIPMSHDRFLVQVGEESSTTTIHVCNRFGTTCRIAPGYTAQELGEAGTAPFTVTDHSYNAFLYEYTNETGVYDPINKKLIMWVSAGSGARGRVRVYNIDGDTIKFHFESDFTPSDISTANAQAFPSLEVTDKGHIVVSWQVNSNHYGERVVGSYNHERDGILWGTVTTWSSEHTSRIQQLKADDGKIVNLHVNGEGGSSWSLAGRSMVFQTPTTTLTSDNFLGFSAYAYSDGSTATIQVPGSTTDQSGLTASKKYYVQDDGTLGTSKESFNVVAGKALSATKLLITEI